MTSSVLDSKGFINEIVWLRNLDRIFKMIPKLEYPSFLDLGSGSGVAISYVSMRYTNINSAVGVEYDSELFQTSLDNMSKLPNTIKKKMKFYNCDVANFLIDPLPYYIFMFNPFGKEIFHKFIQNNYIQLKSFNSYLLLANDHLISEAENYSTLIARNNRFNLSVLKF